MSADWPPRELIEGRPVLIVVDIQGGAPDDGAESALPFMPGYGERMANAPSIVEAARRCGVPIVFFQEAHRRDLVDFGRELDGAEGVHLLEGDPGTDISADLGVNPDDYVIRKRRYSCFFGTELEILLKGLRAETLILDAHEGALRAMEYLQTGARRSMAQVVAAFERYAATTGHTAGRP